MMKHYARLIIYMILTLCTIGYIFGNSLQSSEESNQKSEVVAEYVKPMLDRNHETSEEELNKKVRKIAHGIEFAILGICLSLLTLEIAKKRKQIMISFPLLLALCTAVTDEFLQSFHGRTDAVSDVLIDFGGTVFGILLVWLVLLLQKNEKLGGRSHE